MAQIPSNSSAASMYGPATSLMQGNLSTQMGLRQQMMDAWNKIIETKLLRKQQQQQNQQARKANELGWAGVGANLAQTATGVGMPFIAEAVAAPGRQQAYDLMREYMYGGGGDPKALQPALSPTPAQPNQMYDSVMQSLLRPW